MLDKTGLTNMITHPPLIRIVVADNNTITANGLEVTLNQQPGLCVAGKAGDFNTLLKLAEVHQPEIIIIDSRLPGIALPGAIKSLVIETQADIILYEQLITVQHFPFYTHENVQGIICKNDPVEILVERILKVYAGKQYYCSAIKQFLGNNIRKIKRQLNLFSKREMDILQLLGEEKTTRQIATALYASVDCIESASRNLKLLTGSKKVTGVVKFAMKYGFIE